jgi:hypothetical protein
LAEGVRERQQDVLMMICVEQVEVKEVMILVKESNQATVDVILIDRVFQLPNVLMCCVVYVHGMIRNKVGIVLILIALIVVILKIVHQMEWIVYKLIFKNV